MLKIPRPFRNRTICQTGAFSLVEMLVALAVISLLSVLAVQSFGGLSQSLNLTNGHSAVVAELDFARQTAISRCQTVEVRFYADKNSPNSSMFQGYNWDTIVSLIPADPSVPNSQIQWLEKPHFLPASVIFDTTTSQPSFSSLISAATTGSSSPTLVTSGSSSPGTPSALQGEIYIAFHFRSDGRTDLSWQGQDWCVTLRNLNSQPGKSGTPSANFITILLDPVLGHTRMYQSR